MKLVRKSGTLGLAVLAAIASPYALADDSGWYAGANIGQSKSRIDDPRIIGQLLRQGITTTSIVDNNRDTGYKLFGGYRINKNFALEGGYFDLGRFNFAATTAAPNAGTLNGRIKLKGVNFDAVGILPITEQFSAFGRLGANYAQARDNFTSTGAIILPANPNPSKSQLNYKFGAGLQYDFTESVGMRLEAERYHINDAVGNKGDIDLVSVGLVYHFGVEKPAPVTRTVAPEYVAEPPHVAVAPAPEPTPVVVEPPPPPPPPPPAPVAPRKVVFSTDSSVDSLFDFGKSVLKPAGKQAIDRFVADLKGASYDLIMVVGHTDRIGSHAYNMKLSTRRAEVVKAYLEKSAGIPAGKITAKGVDGSHPVTKPGQCKGKKVTKKLITCLAPDRRVEVEVSATRTSKE